MILTASNQGTEKMGEKEAPASTSTVKQALRERQLPRPKLASTRYLTGAPPKIFATFLSAKPCTQGLTFLIRWHGAQANWLQHEGPSRVGRAGVHPEVFPAGQDLALTAVLAKQACYRDPSWAGHHCPYGWTQHIPVQGAVVLLHFIGGHQGHRQEGNDEQLLQASQGLGISCVPLEHKATPPSMLS